MIGAAAGWLAGAGPAAATPFAPTAPSPPLAPADCQYSIFGHDSVIEQDNGIQIHVVWAGKDGGGTASYSSQGFDWAGPIRGGIVNGTNKLDFTVAFEQTAGRYDRPNPHSPTNHYTGTIDSNSSASGITVNDSGVSNRWTISDPAGFGCVRR